MKRTFLMLAHTWDSENIKNWAITEKLDGVRAYWDGGITRGKNLPVWANRNRDHRDHICTGLWSRYGKVIHAPGWWLDKLPNIPLDGELWSGRGKFQTTVGIVKSLASTEWDKIQYRVFDSPPYSAVFCDGELTEVNFKTVFSQLPERLLRVDMPTAYRSMRARLEKMIPEMLVPIIPFDLEKVVESGGEGLMARDWNSFWFPKRSKHLLKIKPLLTGSGLVVDTTAGLGKHLGRMGSVTVLFNNVKVSVSGFTDLEREENWLGRTINFTYRELTDSGIPKEARYKRI